LKYKNSIVKTLTIVIISLSFGILLPTSLGFSQSNLRIYEDIGGGGSTTPESDNSSNTTLYIVAGVAIAGVLAYAIFIKNKNKEPEESDSTSSLIGFDDEDLKSEFNDFEHELQKAKDQIPVNVFFGVKDENAFVSDKTYLMGISVRF
jgi:hypothetical protein